jgi:hypothetical protein
MRWPGRLLLMAALLVTGGCLTGFEHPLGEPEDGFIEPKLLGAWTCTSVDDPKGSSIRIMDFDEDVVDDPPSVRQRLAERLDDPEVLPSLLSCTRARGKD